MGPQVGQEAPRFWQQQPLTNISTADNVHNIANFFMFLMILISAPKRVSKGENTSLRGEAMQL